MVDHAKAILENADLSNPERAILWDAYHGAPHADALTRHLAALNVSPDLQEQLIAAKQSETESAPSAGASGTATAIRPIAEMDPRMLALAESHPRVLQALLNEIGSGQR